MLNTRLWAYAVDAACVLVFAAVGRSSHEEGWSLGGLATTAGPFLVGLAVAWAGATVLAARRGGRVREGDPFAALRWAWTLPVATWAVGMALRVASSQGVSGAFPLVALGFLAVTLVSWRVLVRATRTAFRRAAPRRSGAPAPGTPGHGG